MRRRLLERLEQRDLGVLRELGRVVDDHDAPAPLERAKGEVLLHRPDLLDGDVLHVVALLEIDQTREDDDVRVDALLDLRAGQAHAASARDTRLGHAVQRLRQPQRHRVLAYRSRAAELVRLGYVATDRLIPEPLEEATLPDHISHRVYGGW